MSIIKKIINLFKGTEISGGKVNASSVNAMSVSADIISVNNDMGHFEIGNETGKTASVKTDNCTLVFKGGILVDIIEEE